MNAEEHVDAVVVGSGFGGAVMTERLAEAGLRVCLLERGKPYPTDAATYALRHGLLPSEPPED